MSQAAEPTALGDSLATVAPRARRSAALAAGERAEEGETRSSARRRLLVAAVVVLVGAGLLALLYSASVHADPGDSDGAAVVLQGQAMSQGHLLLKGWSLSLDSFWTVDALFYLVAILLGGLTPILIHLVPAVIALLVIAAGAYLASEGNRGIGAALGALTVVALLGFPTHSMAYFFLRGPLHVATALWCLVAFIGTRRGRFDVGWAIAVIFLAAGTLGDLQALAYGVVPLFLAGLVAMLRCRSWRGGIAQAGAAVGGVVVAYVVRKVAETAGTFGIGEANPRASVSQLGANFHHAVTETAQLIGVTSRDFGTGGTPRWLEEVHVVSLAVLVAAGALALVALVVGAALGRGTIAAWPLRHLWRSPRPAPPRAQPLGRHSPSAVAVAAGAPAAVAVDGDGPGSLAGRRGRTRPTATRAARAAIATGTGDGWRLDDVLTIACFTPAGTYMLLAVTPDVQYGRYLTAGVIFAAILAGRVVGRIASLVDWRRSLAVATASIVIAVTVLFGAGTGYTITGAAPVQRAAQLSQFLEAHHLDLGVSDYWSSNITTLWSRGQVQLRAVVSKHGVLQ
ncbi:MAG: hypothetical protein ACRD0B_01285, partial [Acidimicrobiales bacterium]